jgi:hypothetical protein
MNHPVASSLITFGSIDDWTFQSKLSSVFRNGRAPSSPASPGAFLLGRDLAGQLSVQEVGVAHVPLRRLLEDGAQPRGNPALQVGGRHTLAASTLAA